MVDRVRQVRWRSEVLSLVRRPVPISLDAARESARTFLQRAAAFDSREREFVEQIENRQLRPELLMPERVRDRIAVNPALLWRLASGAGTLEER